MLYKIKSIKHNGTCDECGTERTDDRYHQRIGRVVELNIDDIEIGYPLLIRYIKDPDGTSMKFSLLKTSCVKNYITVDDLEGIVKYITIETQNSIFEFERVDDNE